MAPSGCNFQPWEAIVLTSSPLRSLQDRLLGNKPDDPLEYDFSAPGAVEKYKSRLQQLGTQMYGAMGIGREQADLRQQVVHDNIRGFGAPLLLLCHFPKIMKEAQWSDVGMWLQTIMLLLRGEGLDSCPQEYLGMYGRTIKDHLALPDDTLLFCGMAIGWRDDDKPVNAFERDRVALADQVIFVGFDT